MLHQFAKTALISNSAIISKGTFVWEFAQIRESAFIDENCTIGSFVFIDSNVQIGKNCKIQNRALIYDPAKISNNVFIGPGVILTNDRTPRATNSEGRVKTEGEWEKVGVIVEEGASIGAGAVCIAPLTIGKWALIGAGSIVTSDVADFALVVGNPSKQIGWVGKAGVKLREIEESEFQCPVSLTRYSLKNSRMSEIIVK